MALNRCGGAAAIATAIVVAAVLTASDAGYAAEKRAPTEQELRMYGAEKALFHYLLDDYDKSVRPVTNFSETISVTIGVKLNQIMELQERLQILTTIIAVDQEWRDQFLQWNPDDFGGLTSTYLPCSRVWLPDVVLYNGVSNIRELQYMQAHVSVQHTGHVVWFPLVKVDSSCTLDIRFYPYDEQLCFLKFGSWSYSMKEVDVVPGLTGVEKQDYIDNGEFELKMIQAERVENVYDCCPVPIPTLNIGLRFRRRPMFSIFTLAVPCTLLSLMTATAFVLPPENGGKIEVQLSVMLSLAVFMLLIGESLPPTPDSVPLLGVHIVIQMGVTAMSFICSIFVMRVIKMDYREMPPWLKKVNLRAAEWLCVGHSASGKEKEQGKSCASSDEDWYSRGQNGAAHFRMHRAVNGQRRSGDTKNSCDTQKLCSEQNGTSTQDSESSFVALSPSAESSEKDLLVRYAKTVVEHLRRQEEKDGRKEDWLTLGLVLDRFLLICLVLVNICTTLYMYVIAPTLPVPKV